MMAWVERTAAATVGFISAGVANTQPGKGHLTAIQSVGTNRNDAVLQSGSVPGFPLSIKVV